MNAGEVHPLAGKPAPPSVLVDVDKLRRAYYDLRPDPSVPEQRVAFGTSGHRGSSFDARFNEAHILTITQAICHYRKAHHIDGPLHIGWDTHALSEPARLTAMEVLAANGVDVRIDSNDRPTPTPVISRAILAYNRGRDTGLADGIVITPSHNPPRDGGFKYDPPSGGPADTQVTAWIEAEANRLLASGLRGVERAPETHARNSAAVHRFDYVTFYVEQLAAAIDMDVLRGTNLRFGVDPLGGASLAYWDVISERYRLQLDVVNRQIDPAFRFMTLDWDGAIRMDPSSQYVMARLIGLRDRFDVAFATDPDADRHGIVSRRAGLLAPNHYLAVCVDYLFRQRSGWNATAAVGKTVVSSSMIDRVAARLGRRVVEVPVGFKHFVGGLLDGSLGFAGEESAGASFVQLDGSPWTTDKDGLLLGLVAMEMTARTGRDPSERYQSLVEALGESFYQRIDAPATAEQKKTLSSLSPEAIGMTALAGEPATALLTTAPGDGRAIGGIKVVASHGWFAARPSGTEAVYKLYAESFSGPDHLRRIQEEAQAVVRKVLAAHGAEHRKNSEVEPQS